jgi:hypothetical protein
VDTGVGPAGTWLPHRFPFARPRVITHIRRVDSTPMVIYTMSPMYIPARNPNNFYLDNEIDSHNDLGGVARS